MKTTTTTMPRTPLPLSLQERLIVMAQPHGRPPRPVMVAWQLGTLPCRCPLLPQSRALTIPTHSLPRSTNVWTCCPRKEAGAGPAAVGRACRTETGDYRLKTFLVESLSGFIRWEWVPTLRRTSSPLLCVRKELDPAGRGFLQ